MSGMLAQQPVFDDLPQTTTREYDSVQRGRLRAGLQPLSPIRVLNLDRILRPSHSPAEPTGREMPPHWRRGKQITLRHPRYVNMRGQTIKVKGHPVRPDKGPSSPPIYVVQDFSEETPRPDELCRGAEKD